MFNVGSPGKAEVAAPHRGGPKKASLLNLRRFRNDLDLKTLALPLGGMHRASPPFVSLQEVWIVVRYAVHALPRKDGVVSRTKPAQGESSRLVCDGFSIVIDPRP